MIELLCDAFRHYLSSIKKETAIFLSGAGIIGTVSYLSGHIMTLYFYALILWTVASAAVLLIGFISFYRNYKQYRSLLEKQHFTPDELPSALHPLEQLNHELTAHLHHHTETVLTSSREQLKENKDYYTRWTHQIKTPIAASRLLLQSDADHPLNRQLSQELIKIETYTQSALTYAKLGTMQNDLSIEPTDLDILIKDLLKKYATFFIQKKLKLIYESSSATVLTDKRWTLYIIEQLLSNAIKYTPSGEIIITITANQETTLTIRDTGIGILPQDLPRIFENGFRGINTGERSSGIGLYLAKEISDRLGHRLEVNSEQDKGTLVALTFIESC